LATSNFEAAATRIVITTAAELFFMANSRQVANLEENHKLDDALAERLAKIMEVLQDIED
jgi:hypothetical protein